jgi:hypothetical protein
MKADGCSLGLIHLVGEKDRHPVRVSELVESSAFAAFIHFDIKNVLRRLTIT